jgi:hypothetical protein
MQYAISKWAMGSNAFLYKKPVVAQFESLALIFAPFALYLAFAKRSALRFLH